MRVLVLAMDERDAGALKESLGGWPRVRVVDELENVDNPNLVVVKELQARNPDGTEAELSDDQAREVRAAAGDTLTELAGEHGPLTEVKVGDRWVEVWG